MILDFPGNTAPRVPSLLQAARRRLLAVLLEVEPGQLREIQEQVRRLERMGAEAEAERIEHRMLGRIASVTPIHEAPSRR